MTVHPYDGSRVASDDIRWAAQHNKEAIVEEFGIGGRANRTQRYKTEIDYWKSLGAKAVLPWGFIAKEVGRDNGNGDTHFGVDNIWHTADYDSIMQLLKSYSTASTLPSDGGSLIRVIIQYFGQAGDSSKGDQNSDGKINELDFGAVYSQ